MINKFNGKEVIIKRLDRREKIDAQHIMPKIMII